MGRKKKYITEEERIQAKNARRMKYYWQNCKKEKKKNLERYYENKEKH